VESPARRSSPPDFASGCALDFDEFVTDRIRDTDARDERVAATPIREESSSPSVDSPMLVGELDSASHQPKARSDRLVG
jgi:hypothetical protein